jgi:hypothetical protein
MLTLRDDRQLGEAQQYAGLPLLHGRRLEHVQ